MLFLSGSTCYCKSTKPYLTFPYLTKVNNPCPKPAGGYLNLALPVVTLPQPLTQTLVAWLLISEVTKIWWKVYLTAKDDLCQRKKQDFFVPKILKNWIMYFTCTLCTLCTLSMDECRRKFESDFIWMSAHNQHFHFKSLIHITFTRRKPTPIENRYITWRPTNFWIDIFKIFFSFKNP